MKNDEFGDRMKAYEAVETARVFDPSQPIYVRIDGRSFSSFTRGMKRPFDEVMTRAMVETAKHIVQATHARVGYTQSDEISLVYFVDDPESELLFGGRIHKLTSVLASIAAAKFARVCPPGFEDRLPHFDARVFQVPDRTEAANAILWRTLDARKNAISMVAQANFSPRQLHGKGQADMLEMLAGIGVDFHALPTAFKSGTFLRRQNIERELTAEELAAIPERHRPTGPVTRSVVIETHIDRFVDVENRVDFVFDGAAPEYAEPAEELEVAPAP